MSKDLLLYPNWSLYTRDQETLSNQVPNSLNLQHSNDSTDLPLWNHVQSQHAVFGGPPVNQTVTMHDDMNYSNSSLTPPLSSSNPGFYGWPINNPHTDHQELASYQLNCNSQQGYMSSVVMTPESDVESSSFSSPLTYMDSAASLQYMPYLQMHSHAMPQQLPLPQTKSLSPPPSPLTHSTLMERRASVEEMIETQMVKLTRMTEDRIEHIKRLAEEKGINPQTVASVLTLYTPEGRRRYLQSVGGDQSELCGDDIMIQITLNGGFPTSEESSEGGSRRGSTTTSAASKKISKNHRKARPDYVKRPLNSFMLYRKSQTQSAMAYAVHSQLKLNHQNISQIIGLMWQTESKEVKEQFSTFAGKEKELHRVLHPDYKFCPQKKKRKD